ncbi:MAG: hypothetical protein ABR540_16410 [Acidimicrobiales bacterium]|nr:hypothetical protein [Actinomycetota bacterium]
MSTFLVTLTVVVVAIAAALVVAIGDPDQPATLRSRPWRDRRLDRQRQRATQKAAAAAVRPPPRTEPVERSGGGMSEQWIPAAAGVSGWVRLRSGVVLTVLLAIVGALLAASISGLLLLFALAIRDAVG